MAKGDFEVISLLWEIMNQKTGEIGKVDYKPQKPRFDSLTPMEQPFPRSTPEAQGVSSQYIARFVKELGSRRKIHMHQLMILRHGTVIYEGGFDPYPAGIWHASYSMCKSFTGMAVGLLIDDGVLSLEDHLTDILADEYRAAHPNILTILRLRAITVRHLLTMSTGVAFNEAGAVSGNDWVRNYFDSAVKFNPGTRFEYNSMNSFMLSAIVSKKTGKTMFEFLQERLFAPMGIRKVFWETSPKGITKGGWGLFITQEDAAKLGLLYMQQGRWNGRQLISEAWVKEATSPQIVTDPDGRSRYCYHVWTDFRPESFTYNGMLGQNVHCFPDIDMILVTNAGNDEVFQTGMMTAIIRKYFGGSYHPSDKPLPADFTGHHRLLDVKQEFMKTGLRRQPILRGGWDRGYYTSPRHTAVSKLAAHIDGKTYEMAEKGVGLFPLICQVVHTNYTRGIQDLTFHRKGETLILTFTEGTESYDLPVGFEKARLTTINMNGEPYLVSTEGRIGRNEDDIPVLTLKFAFPEEATERNLKIFFTETEEIELHWSESPGDVIITHTVEQITLGSGNTNPLVQSLMKNMNPSFIQRTMQCAVQPVVKAHLVNGEKK